MSSELCKKYFIISCNKTLQELHYIDIIKNMNIQENQESQELHLKGIMSRQFPQHGIQGEDEKEKEVAV